MLDALPVNTPPVAVVEQELPHRGNMFYRALRHPWFMPYNRLAVFVTALNGLWFLNGSFPSAETLMIPIVLNFALATLIRQQRVINALFSIATSVPHRWPLSMRWAAGKVYHFGGIHVGAYFSGALWFVLYAITLTKVPPSSKPTGLTALVWAHTVLLFVTITVALPPIRARYHNTFERVARFGGWTSLILFWTQTLLLGAFFDTATVALAFITCATALPWLRLKKVSVNLLRPSSHAVLASFDYGVTPFAGSSTDLSRNPLWEWHSFANVPSPGKSGFRLTISRAGDWTGKLIDDVPEKIWVKGIPTAGVGNIEKLFKKVIWVATGSGIGPCLPHLLSQQVPARLVWSTRNPVRTYGSALVNEILHVQPEAVIWDTDAHGKPDLVRLAFDELVRSDAEAVICIANKKVTWHVVQEFESRGIPAFGAIWDS